MYQEHYLILQLMENCAKCDKLSECRKLFTSIINLIEKLELEVSTEDFIEEFLQEVNCQKIKIYEVEKEVIKGEKEEE
jgi:hypothetical protein